jgi:asparagine synthase (glutamine-hydrolysing)
VLRAGEHELVARFAQWQGVGPDGVLGPELARKAGVVDSWRADYGTSTNRDGFRQFQYLETHTRLVDFINFEVDRMSMAHSIEARVPFLDHELWEYTGRLPSALLTSGRPKEILRRVMRGILPAETLVRAKQGLAAPYSRWLRAARLPEWAEAALEPQALARAGYFSLPAVARLRAEHAAWKHDHGRVLMGVLSTQLWHSTFGVQH